MPERVTTEMAHDSDFFRRWLQFCLVKRTWPVWQFASTERTGEHPVFINGVWTLQSPCPQYVGQSKIEWNGFPRCLRFAVTHVLHDD